MQIGMIGLGKMGAGMVRRLMKGGYDCVVHDLDRDAVELLRIAAERKLWNSKQEDTGR